ncbi:MAG: hypothetical protein QM784_10580 [Polyangiaceae bacterium]
MMDERDPPRMRRALERILRLCLDESSPDYDVTTVSDYIEVLFAEVGREDISSIIAGAVSAGAISLEKGATVIGVAAWSGNENGASAQLTLETWLRDSADPVEVGLALAQNVMPFADYEECLRVLDLVGQRFPQYGERCADLIAARRALQKRSKR